MHKTQADLLHQMKEVESEVEVGALYSHYRDLENPYTVIAVGLLEFSEEPAVVYEKDSIIWIRSLSSWKEEVLLEDGSLVPRFAPFKLGIS